MIITSGHAIATEFATAAMGCPPHDGAASLHSYHGGFLVACANEAHHVVHSD